jgi:ABC-type proline/glycine betaine transport system substrate-binding protein
VFDSEVFLMLLNRNNEKQRSTLFFCYYPDDIFMDRNVSFMNADSHDDKLWKDIINHNKPVPHSGTSWPKTQIKIAYRSNLLNEHSELTMLLDHFFIENDELIKMLATIKNGVDAEQVAQQWIEQNNELILEWLTGFSFSKNKATLTD